MRGGFAAGSRSTGEVVKRYLLDARGDVDDRRRWVPRLDLDRD
jgi:hypothetical protein